MSIHDETFNMGEDPIRSKFPEGENKTSTPPLISDEYVRGIKDACKALEDEKTWEDLVAWCRDNVGTQPLHFLSGYIEAYLLPNNNAQSTEEQKNDNTLPTQDPMRNAGG